MTRRTLLSAAILLYVLLPSCSREPEQDTTTPQSVPIVVTADIQAGIENHIEEQTKIHNGYFPLPFEDKQLHLKLVRVHTEYLANLGSRRHFACVDLVDTEGEVYDVDFFLAGDPGAMVVTETTIHKINGQPLYLWEQNPDDTWKRVPATNAPDALLGVIRERDEFDFHYQATLPEITDTARMWLPLPASDAFQTITIKKIDAPGTKQTLQDPDYHNQALCLTLSPNDSNKIVTLHFHVKRLEKPPYDDPDTQPEKFLNPERLVPLNENFLSIAKQVLQNVSVDSDLVRARALYDHVIDRMRYIKFGPGWGKGDAVYACDARTGNCTDFHAYFIALARAAKIPARFAIGAAVPSERDQGGVDGYHCWAEFYADNKWWPVDISEADKYSSLATYYFGHHPANRVEFSKGRDLRFDPAPASGPINFLAYPLLEIAGKPVKPKTFFSFNRTTSPL